MEMFTGMSSTFVLVASEATTELLLMVISAVAWFYADDMSKCFRKLLKRRGPLAASHAGKLPTHLEHENAEAEASSSEPEPEAELLPAHSPEQPSKIPSPALLKPSKPEIRKEIKASRVTVPHVPQPQSVLVSPPGLDLPPGLEPEASQPRDPEKTKRKKSTTTGKPKPKQEIPMREIGRCVCWKDSFGFLVDENGSRLFIRQTDVEGEKPLLAGQLVLFRRAEQPARGTPKGRDVVLVDIEMAKILRAAEREGMQWSTFMKGVLDDDPKLLSSFKSLQNTASHKGKLANFKTEVLGLSKKTEAVKKTNEATKGSVSSGAKIQPSRNEMATAKKDDDLKAFLGSGSIEDMRANLKYAPQWVTDKFNSRHGLAS
eukprot:gnl/TRDRNA2_/TRDRNA2_131790_c0_seq6.p1 gnl/TRDRNA2_/TRDRNA2_131790_c0~~gnl/TRDRNA2_/TRDRNA2_131790_c0_seq6.p1  ORF type:complete len:373 (-),score=77.85 gnl/TRDRNA2_/TRDRNA2_131790_c0_seq6:190-1308(-)